MIVLPIDAHLDRIVREVRRTRAVVVVAPPGAGKTTRVPPALASDGPVLVLQPRRMAARAVARRIAEEHGWTVGREVGWHVRFERHFTRETRVLVATEGILTAKLLQDPLATELQTIVLDEFHERSIHADLGLALARQAWRARNDLRLVVMSATLDPAPIQTFLGGCALIEVAASSYPIDIDYVTGQTLPDAARELAASSAGQVLCFLPGAAEIARARAELARTVPQLDVIPLHGSLSGDDQDRALEPAPPRGRIILATNIAETSLTVPGVDIVIDSGFHKVARYDPARGIDSLDTERIPLDSVDQRAGRAARLGPGRVRRLWDRRDRLRPHREPDIARIDLAAPVLDVLAWGGDLEGFEWFEPPPEAARRAALDLLSRLGAVAGGRLTALGSQLRLLPIHPRLARILVAAGGAREAAMGCALLAERNVLPPRHESTTCDLLAAIDHWSEVPGHVRQVARMLEDAAARVLGGDRQAHVTEIELRRAIFEGYGDRLAQRREPHGSRVRLATGTGATLAPECGVRDGELLVALDVTSVSARLPAPDALVRIASRVEREWVIALHVEDAHELDPASGRVRAVRRQRYGALVLSEQAGTIDPAERSRVLSTAFLSRALSEDDERLLIRLKFAGQPADLGALVQTASLGARSLDEIDLAAHLDPGVRRELARLAPETLRVPSGRLVRLDYHRDGSVSAAVKLQELFGLAETPRVGRRQEPVLLHLLAPNGRPVQATRDLQSFWTHTYPDVRKELRGRYPKHPWPDDPWSATPTARTIRKK